MALLDAVAEDGLKLKDSTVRCFVAFCFTPFLWKIQPLYALFASCEYVLMMVMATKAARSNSFIGGKCEECLQHSHGFHSYFGPFAN